MKFKFCAPLKPSRPTHLTLEFQHWCIVKTNIGKKFLQLIDTHFPKDHPLHPIINRNTIKMSYRNTPNIKKIISSHNTKLLKSEKSEPPCNCQKNPCPLPGQCRAKSVIYQATVTTQQNPPQTETYIGMTSREFKKRAQEHTRHTQTSLM